jgi:aminoacrylate hydrolase
MPRLNTHGISLYYELHGNPANPPVLLLTGLVIVPDHRGTGQSTHAADGYTTEQLADDMASLIEHLSLGPVHVVGSSTGGAIAQYMALNHSHTVRSLTLSSAIHAQPSRQGDRVD